MLRVFFAMGSSLSHSSSILESSRSLITSINSNTAPDDRLHSLRHLFRFDTLLVPVRSRRTSPDDRIFEPTKKHYPTLLLRAEATRHAFDDKEEITKKSILLPRLRKNSRENQQRRYEINVPIAPLRCRAMILAVVMSSGGPKCHTRCRAKCKFDLVCGTSASAG